MINKICLNCKKAFEIYPYRERTAKYCSKKCLGESKIGKPSHRKGIKLSEEHKEKLIESHKGLIPWNKDTKGLVKPNSGSFKKGYIPHNKGLKKKSFCIICNKEMIIYRGDKWVNKHKTCSKECKIEAIKRARAKQIFTIESQIKKGLVLRGRKLSKEHIAKISGPNNYHWKGGPDNPIKLLRGSFNYKQWRLQVYKRDHWTCQICGYKGTKIVANHIKTFKDYPELRFIITNGITICDFCDNKLVKRHERKWESYFNFNLMTKGFIEDEFIPIKMEVNS